MVETHWNVLVLTSGKWILVIHQQEKTLLLKTLGSWYVGLCVCRASALKASVVTEEQPNLPLAFGVLSNLIISGSDTSRVSNCQVTETLAELQREWSRPTPPVCGGDSCYADITVGGWGVGICVVSLPHCTVLLPAVGVSTRVYGTPVLQLFLLARSSSVEASVDCRTCLRSWVSTQAINLCGVCSKAVPRVWAAQLGAGRRQFP